MSMDKQIDIPSSLLKYDNVNIHFIEDGNHVWFKGNDVAGFLGYQRPRNAIADHVDDEDKCALSSFRQALIFNATLNDLKTWYINESGLYTLILRSNMPQAKTFKRWVTTEVLPSIRKHGAYATHNELQAEIEAGEHRIMMLEESAASLKEEVEVLQSKLEISNALRLNGRSRAKLADEGVGLFLQQCCERNFDALAEVMFLFRKYKLWLKHAPVEASLFPASYATFRAAMELTRNYKTTVCGGENRFVGIEVKSKWR